MRLGNKGVKIVIVVIVISAISVFVFASIWADAPFCSWPHSVLSNDPKLFEVTLQQLFDHTEGVGDFCVGDFFDRSVVGFGEEGRAAGWTCSVLDGL
jgi:hypothetical protein